MKRRNIRKPIVVLALVAAMLFPTAANATEAQDGGDSGSVILNGGTGGEAGNAEAQEVYQELLDSVSFIATDPMTQQSRRGMGRYPLKNFPILTG